MIISLPPAPQAPTCATARRVNSQALWNTKSKNLSEHIINRINYTIIDEQEHNAKRLKHNLSKLAEIATFRQNWNGYGAQPLNPNLLKKTRKLISELTIQPELFPTADDSIQIEWEKPNGEYLEIQITLDNQLTAFYIDPEDNERQSTINANSTSINDIVSQFYASSI